MNDTSASPAGWRVTVSRNGEHVVSIERESLSGREISPADEAAIRESALNLLAFIGDPPPPCFSPKRALATFLGEKIDSEH